MTPVKSLKNQYLGVNAHLHSYWQANGDWSEFHTSYIVQLSRTFKAQLLPLGYTAGIEQSLQIRRDDGEIRRPTPDLTIYTQNSRTLREAPVAYLGDTQQLTLTLDEVLQKEETISEKPYRALALYESLEKRDRGEPIAWIELLSPSNKPGGRDAATYRDKRRTLLERGLVLVEIDYLHESSPTFQGIPDYRTRATRRKAEPGSYAYRIVVVDPRPQLNKGKIKVYQFGVDTSLPAATIPLQGNDSIDFNFGFPYHEAVQMELFTVEFVDYSQLPQHFDRYNQDDQARIANRMLAVLEAAQKGIDLETGPFPVKELPLETVLAHIEAICQST
jgi:Protein of unknown function (DUF4058)